MPIYFLEWVRDGWGPSTINMAASRPDLRRDIEPMRTSTLKNDISRGCQVLAAWGKGHVNFDLYDSICFCGQLAEFGYLCYEDVIMLEDLGRDL